MGTKPKIWPWRVALPGLALLAGASAAEAAPRQTSASAQAVIQSQVELFKTGDLNFGNMASGTTAGTAVINAVSGARTLSGGLTAMGGTVSAASFSGTAERLSLVIINDPVAPVTLTRVGGTETMKITDLTLSGGQILLVGAGRTFGFNVGGTLAVGARQAEGAYVGSFNVTVDYY